MPVTTSATDPSATTENGAAGDGTTGNNTAGTGVAAVGAASEGGSRRDPAADLLIIGAGPKAVAVVAKAAAMRGLGLAAPRITVVDPLGVAGNWTDRGRWTTGRQPLGTLPEKDVGFPYASRLAGPKSSELDDALFSLSWPRYLRAVGRYASWVDRGRPHPTHDRWASYLAWVADRAEIDLRLAEVTFLDIEGGRWVATAASEGGSLRIDARRVMVTGPGPADRAPLGGDTPGVLSVAGFWEAASRGEGVGTDVVVVGAGETAGTIVVDLGRRGTSRIRVVSPSATAFSRGESHFENSLFTSPEGWGDLDESVRRDFIARTDRGVFSSAVQAELDTLEGVSHVTGQVVSATACGDGSARVVASLADGRDLACDTLIDARGARPDWFVDILGRQARAALEEACGGCVVPALESAIGRDLGVEGLAPPLYLPMLAGLRQGPGFANLSCLGELSDRILAGCEA